ncbi:hypothetical protein B0T21DRAFT_351557 [Apiosordaria backusii]|uniref:BHLH domain-containing protein n=1 Tax=Apiosordaria backusii TaxID=314023 RepID=A0AA40DWC1_9PEZI|nr:hypothetical protein B0T21DRAFT_351557 [Apiosordaria backusii]
MEQQRPASQKFGPAALAGVLNSPEDHRDSAYYSSGDVSSKRMLPEVPVGENGETDAPVDNSTGSGLGVLSPPSSGFQTSPVDKTPSPTTTTHLLPQPLVSPTNSNMSVASIVSPTTPVSADPRRFDRTQSLDSAPNSAAFGHGELLEPSMSRRESVDSRFNQGFGQLGLSGSPYASHNQSTTSIHNTLQQQRLPRANLDSLATNRISNGYQPNAERKPEGHPRRVAPTITGPTTSVIARAAEPTKGQAWAFPEDDNAMQRVSGPPQSLANSRRSSVAESLASSQYTVDSRLPPGQRRLDDPPHVPEYHQRLSVASEYSTTHHHSLQHKQLSDLQNEEGGLHAGSQPYSRTPELRVTHKLAERKRRTEMKELFEQLRDLMPQERGTKASKWEILTKAIQEHTRQTNTIRDLQAHVQQLAEEVSKRDAQMEEMRRQIQELQYRQNHSMQGPPGSEHYANEQYARVRQAELPPLRSFDGPANGPGSEAMTGVQYEGPRSNGTTVYSRAPGAPFPR